MKRLVHEVMTAARANLLLLDCLLEAILAVLARKYVSLPPRRLSSPTPIAPHRLRRVLEFIDANLAVDISLANLVTAAGSSQAHFSRAFHRAVGTSPYRYVIARRIEYAKALLLTGSDSLNCISVRCGFNSQQQFGCMFKHVVGVGPKRFRAERCTHRR